MGVNLERELALHGKMTAEELWAKYLEVFGEASIVRQIGELSAYISRQLPACVAPREAILDAL